MKKAVGLLAEVGGGGSGFMCLQNSVDLGGGYRWLVEAESRSWRWRFGPKLSCRWKRRLQVAEGAGCMQLEVEVRLHLFVSI